MNLVNQRQINDACGRALWMQLTDVIFLKDAIRQTDRSYSQLLFRVASGKCTRKDYDTLNTRLISNPSVYNDKRFGSAQIVVHTNQLRQEINKSVLIKQCKDSGQKLYCILARDTHAKYKLSKHTLKELKTLPDSKTQGLQGNCMMKIGGKMHLTTNLAVELGLTNGSEGTIEKIIFNEKEEFPLGEASEIVQLKHMPKCVLLRLDNAKCSLPGLPEKIIPVVPVEKTFKYGRRINGRYVSWTIRRLQLPLVSSNCITSYKSQGKDISPIIVDLCPPKTIPIDSSYAYVMLSRCKCLNDLALLRPFPFHVLTSSPPNDLIEEEKRLESIASETAKRYMLSKHLHK